MILVRGVVLALLAGGCNGLLSIDETLPATLDPDHDGFVDDEADNCPGVANAGQEDGNGDGIGDACSTFCTSLCTDATTCDCEDFDTSTEIPTDWFVDQYGGGTADVQTEFTTSDPRGLRLHAPGSPTGGSYTQKAKLVRFIETDRRRIHFEYAWRLSSRSAPPAADHFENTQFGSIGLLDTDQNPLGNVTITNFINEPNYPPNTWVVGIQFPTQRITEIPTIPTNQWIHVGWDVVFANDATGHVTLRIDGAVVFDVAGPTAHPNGGVGEIAAKAGIELLQSCQVNNCGVMRPTTDQNLAHDDLLVRVE